MSLQAWRKGAMIGQANMRKDCRRTKRARKFARVNYIHDGCDSNLIGYVAVGGSSRSGTRSAVG